MHFVRSRLMPFSVAIIAKSRPLGQKLIAVPVFVSVKLIPIYNLSDEEFKTSK